MKFVQYTVSVSLLLVPLISFSGEKKADLSTQVALLERQVTSLETALADLQNQLACITDSSNATDLYFEGCNVHVRNGDELTESTNGLGNLIVGYNEAPANIPALALFCSDGAFDNENDCEQDGHTWGGLQRTGSHNLVVGPNNAYTRYGGLVAGRWNVVNGIRASVLGGELNQARSQGGAIVGGSGNAVNGALGAVLGGGGNNANQIASTVAGGSGNLAAGLYSSIAGGLNNGTLGDRSAISGGNANITLGDYSVVSGGRENITFSVNSTVSGGENEITVLADEHTP